MEEEKAKEETEGKEKKTHNKLHTALTALVMLPILGDVFKKIGTVIAEKGVDLAGEKISQKLGLDVDNSGKGLADEIIFTEVSLSDKLKPNEKQAIEKFEDYLAKFPEQGAEKLVAFHVFVAKGADENSKKAKNINKDAKNSLETAYEIRNINWGVSFLKELLAKTSNKKKIKFLENRGVFSTVSKPSKIKKKLSELPKKVKDWQEDSLKPAMEENAENLNQQTLSLKEKAIAFRDRQKNNLN
ncbi:MAG: hypothetical protein COU40_00540 [Candidatus Moranbacteria bacterium CG10_big_fil_rev_8_21_14_0_10_35_21]|nr:MAG: hypothetical protein COU40_00540 [Candidatus Moranbacteria bacterium CG10_big_fil_rev_8_21_14_0_10_35_21]PJA88843.1 MAG: hypothetical protein CO139_01010 [Candidatus Moranbacteria bacterium CG_4_9_14_3_um_filter_36_9]